MIRLAILLACLLGAAPLHAVTPPASWDGVWQGTIGNLPVRACFQDGGRKMGSYYYLSRMKPIRLEREANGEWTEHQDFPDKSTGTWSIVPAGNRLGGEWRQGDKRLPVALERVQVGKEDDFGSCAARAYIAPRIRPLVETRRPERRGGIAFTRIDYAPARWFDDVKLSSFEFTPVRPGDRAINDFLKLRSDNPASDYIACMQFATSQNGVDGYESFSYDPEELGGKFLRISVHSDNYCGGAHPNHGYWWISFERQSGKRFQFYRWFTAQAAPREYAKVDDTSIQVSPALRKAVLRRFRFDQRECRETVNSTEFWHVGLTRQGLIFTPSLPHVAMACTDDAVVPFRDLSPFFSPEGKAALRRIGLAKF